MSSVCHTIIKSPYKGNSSHLALIFPHLLIIATAPTLKLRDNLLALFANIRGNVIIFTCLCLEHPS